MTPEEKKQHMEERNVNICLYYTGGHSLSECASKFKLGRQRVLLILKEAGVWKPYVRNNRTKFLGVTIHPDTGEALKEKAELAGTSVSQFVSDKLDEIVAKG